MKTTTSEIADATLAVASFKHALLVRVQTAIILKAMDQTYVSPADIPEDIVGPEHRQGVASNAWNSLVALEIIDRVPLTFSHDLLKIYGGRTRNTNADAKGRWVAVYVLRNRSLAHAWLRANNPAALTPRPEPVQTSLPF